MSENEITLTDMILAQMGLASWEIQAVRDETFSRLESYPPILLPNKARESGFILRNEYALELPLNAAGEKQGMLVFRPLKEGAIEYLTWHEGKLFIFTQNGNLFTLSLDQEPRNHGSFNSVDALSLVPGIPQDVLEFLECKLYSPHDENDKQLLN